MLVLSGRESVMAARNKTNTVLGPFHGVGLHQPSARVAWFPGHLSLLPVFPPEGTCSPRSAELLLFDRECVQSHTQPNYCF